MKSSLRPASACFVAAILMACFLASSPGLHAQERRPEPATPAAPTSGESDQLVIRNGMLMGDGENVRATLATITDRVMRRYPRANITLVGVDDVIVQDVSIRWPRRPGVLNEAEEPTLIGFFAALEEASGQGFQLRPFGPQELVLSARERGGNRRMVEVFKLRPLLSVGPDLVHLRSDLNRLEIERSVLEKSPQRAAGLEVPGLDTRRQEIEMLRARIAAASATVKDGEGLIEQIREVVRISLEQLRPDAELPVFQYHAGTGLMIVIGSEDAIEVTRKVVAALH